MHATLCRVIQLMYIADICQSNNSFTTEEEHGRITVANICFGTSIPPFISDDGDNGSKVAS